jgi:hypothetical protein
VRVRCKKNVSIDERSNAIQALLFVSRVLFFRTGPRIVMIEIYAKTNKNLLLCCRNLEHRLGSDESGDRCYEFRNIFAEKFGEKIDVIYSKYC